MNKDSNKKSKQILIISIIITIGVIISLIFFIIKPIVVGVYKTKDVFEEDKLKLEIIKKDAMQSHVFIELVDNLGRDQKLVENALIEKDSIVIFIQDVEKIAKEVGNEVGIAQLATVKTKKTASDETKQKATENSKESATEKNKVRLELEVKGNYRQFSEFLYKLENMTYVFQVEALEVTNSSDRLGSSLRATEELPIDFTTGKIVLSFIPKNSNN